MDRDSKLIFESYKKHLLNEAVQVLPALAGAGAAGATGLGGTVGGTAVGGGLLANIDAIAKMIYDQTPQGQQLIMSQKIERFKDMAKDAQTIIEGLNAASNTPTDTKLISTSLNRAINFLLSVNSQEINQLGQITSKVYQILSKPIVTAQDLASLEVLADNSIEVTENAINNLIKEADNNQEVIQLLENIRAESRKNSSAAKQKAAQARSLVVSTGAGGMPPGDPNDPEYKEWKRRVFKANADKAELETIKVGSDIRQKAELTQAQIRQLNAQTEQHLATLSKLKAETANAWLSTTKFWMILGAGFVGISLLLFPQIWSKLIEGLFYAVGRGVVRAGVGGYEGGRDALRNDGGSTRGDDSGEDSGTVGGW